MDRNIFIKIFENHEHNFSDILYLIEETSELRYMETKVHVNQVTNNTPFET